MPMNEEVRKAVKVVRKHFDLSMDDDASEAWCKVRAELHRLTEIADGVDPLVVRLGEVTTRLEAAEKDAQFLRSHRPIARQLEAANAFLRECHCYFEAQSVDSRTIGESLSLNEKIQAHLSEPRT